MKLGKPKMTNTTAKLVHIYRGQGKHELADTVQSFADSLKRYSDNISKMWVLYEHRCSCGKAPVDPTEAAFMEETGYCATCDHIKQEVLEQQAYEIWKEGDNS